MRARRRLLFIPTLLAIILVAVPLGGSAHPKGHDVYGTTDGVGTLKVQSITIQANTVTHKGRALIRISGLAETVKIDCTELVFDSFGDHTLYAAGNSSLGRRWWFEAFEFKLPGCIGKCARLVASNAGIGCRHRPGSMEANIAAKVVFLKKLN